MLKPYIKTISENKNLLPYEAKQAMEIIMQGNATPAQVAGFISIMRMKGETIDEITAFAQVMRENAVRINIPSSTKFIVDTCGTGGDGANTFNISTVSAFVTAGAGVCVAKHGNRAVSSKSGSADLLKNLGVNIQISPKIMEKCLEDVGIAFLFAPSLHPAMKHAIGPRRELGIRTFFNILGPLTNPAFVKNQVIGLFSPDLLEKIANVLKNMGTKRALVVHSNDGLDELSVCADTKVSELKESGEIKNYTLNLESLGFEKAELSDLACLDENDSVNIAKEILSGETSPKTDIVLLNAGAAIYISGKAENLKQGVELARESISSGKAKEKLELLIKYTNLIRK